MSTKLLWLVPFILVNLLIRQLVQVDEPNVYNGGILLLIGVLITSVIIFVVLQPTEASITKVTNFMSGLISGFALGYAVLFMVVGLYSLLCGSGLLLALGLLLVVSMIAMPFFENYINNRRRCYCVD